MSADITETPLTFGEGGRLFGILTLPGSRDETRPVVMIPNTGVEHRVGPNRLHVQLARALAADGFAVLRFDISGLGDSDPPRGQAANASTDLALALDALQARGLSGRCVLIGLCSGAHDAHQFARQDVRVRGLFSIDGYTYPTPHFDRLLWAGRLAEPIKSLSKLFNRLSGRAAANAPQGVDTDYVVWPPRPQVDRDYTDFLARSLQLAFLFTGDTPWSYLYREQHSDVFPQLRGKALLWFLPHIDHTLTRRIAREEVIALIRDWLKTLN